MDGDMVFPAYGESSLADLPGTVMELLDLETELNVFSNEVMETNEKYENIVVLLIDGLRYDRVKTFEDGFFEKAKDKGQLEKVTSVFPSATPATLTTLHTGRMPLGHSLLGWEMYFKEIDDYLFTLPFRTRDGRDPREVFGDARPEMLFEGGSVYERFSDRGVDVFCLLKRDLVDSEYSKLVSKSCEVVPYDNSADMTFKIRKVLENNGGRKYVYGYTADVDKVSHLEGPESEAVDNQVEMISDALDRNLVENLEEDVADDTLLIITSDHGQILRGERVDLLQWDKVFECVEKDSDGDLIQPSGNAGRSVFLHVKDDKIEKLQRFLQEKLDAKVLKTEQAIEKGLFGSGVEAERFRDRAGDLTIISGGKKIHWFRPEELEDKGVHGGLHEKEMEIPLLYCELSDLQNE